MLTYLLKLYLLTQKSTPETLEVQRAPSTSGERIKSLTQNAQQYTQNCGFGVFNSQSNRFTNVVH